MDISSLSNEELREQLIANGINPGPIVGSTRRLYEAKLRNVIGDVDQGDSSDDHKGHPPVPGNSRRLVLIATVMVLPVLLAMLWFFVIRQQ